MTLTLKIANQSFCMTFQLMMMHHNTKFGNTMFDSLEDTIWENIDILTFHCDLECSNPFFPQKNTLAYNDVKLDQVWLLKNQQFKKIYWKSHIIRALTVSMHETLAHGAASPFQVW